MTQQYTQEECAGHLAEAQAYLVELLQERKDTTPHEIREAKREIMTWRYRYAASLIDDVDELEARMAWYEGVNDTYDEREGRNLEDE